MYCEQSQQFDDTLDAPTQQQIAYATSSSKYHIQPSTRSPSSTTRHTASSHVSELQYQSVARLEEEELEKEYLPSNTNISYQQLVSRKADDNQAVCSRYSRVSNIHSTATSMQQKTCRTSSSLSSTSRFSDKMLSSTRNYRNVYSPSASNTKETSGW